MQVIQLLCAFGFFIYKKRGNNGSYLVRWFQGINGMINVNRLASGLAQSKHAAQVIISVIMKAV